MIYIGGARAARLFVMRACTLMTGADIAHISRGSKLKLKWIHIVNRFPRKTRCAHASRQSVYLPFERAHPGTVVILWLQSAVAMRVLRIYSTRIFPCFSIKQASLNSYEIQSLLRDIIYYSNTTYYSRLWMYAYGLCRARTIFCFYIENHLLCLYWRK